MSDVTPGDVWRARNGGHLVKVLQIYPSTKRLLSKRVIEGHGPEWTHPPVAYATTCHQASFVKNYRLHWRPA